VSASKNETKRGISRALEEDEIHAIVRRFADAAARAIASGYDGVEIHASHTYLLNQFYSPLTNRRDDGYGCASVEDRIRMTLEVVRAAREAIGEKLISVRLGGCDYKEGGSSIADAVEAAKLLEAEGIDLLSITGGMCSYVNPQNNEPGWFQDMTRAIKASGVSTPVMLTGGITTPEQADALLEDGAADLIGVARALLANPRWACED
ncbi:MAG: tRNA-dihydrouridine synthase, partial [Atopobiaceae bacterium]|nr:tRNA-dihydrouridine synthase [Atopobiaceae bacterium]